MNTEKPINRILMKFYIYFLIIASFLWTSCQKQTTDRLVGYWHLQSVTQCDTIPKTFSPGDNPGNYYAFFQDNTLSVGSQNEASTTSLGTILHDFPGTTGYVDSAQGRRYTAWD